MQQKKHKKIIIVSAALLFVVALALLLSCCYTQHLVLIEGKTGKIIQSYPLANHETFAVSFIHSVNNSIVKEGYTVVDGEIYVESCLYKNFGAGVATEVEPPQKLEYLSDGSMLITGFHRKIENLSYIVGTVSDHILWIGDQEISLTELCGKNCTVRFEIKNRFF